MKAFVIYLPEREHSVIHANYMLHTLTTYGIDTSLFEGTNGIDAVNMAKKANKTLYPFSIKNKDLTDHDLLKFIKPELFNEFRKSHFYQIAERQKIDEGDIGKLSRPGVIGCFYSHFHLWEKCIELDEPIMIFEDDVKFFRKYEPVEFDDVLILSLGKSSFLKEPWSTYLENPTLPPAAVTWRNFSMPGASGYIIKPRAARGLVRFYRPYWYPADNAINQYICKLQIHTHLMGRNTLPEEGNISMTKFKDWSQ